MTTLSFNLFSRKDWFELFDTRYKIILPHFCTAERPQKGRRIAGRRDCTHTRRKAIKPYRATCATRSYPWCLFAYYLNNGHLKTQKEIV